MKTQEELDSAILARTIEIKEKFPELAKYIQEMPITIPNKENPNVDLKALEDYLNSLNLLVEDYEKTHSK
jgi:hypothetical protein